MRASVLPSSTLPQMSPTSISSGLRNHKSQRDPARKDAEQRLPSDILEAPRLVVEGMVKITTQRHFHVKALHTSSQPAPARIEAAWSAFCHRKDACRSGAWNLKLILFVQPGFARQVISKPFGDCVGPISAPMSGKQRTVSGFAMLSL